MRRIWFNSPIGGGFCFCAALLCFGLLTLAPPALAHQVLVYAFADGDTIRTESKFAGSGPIQKGEIQVQDKKSGQVLLTGTTDDQGKFSFTIPAEAKAQRMDLLIVMAASMGHQGEWLLKADSYLPKPEKAAAAAPAPGEPAPAAPGTRGAKVVAMDQQALEEAVNRAMERQLAPVKEMLMDMNVRRRTLPEIIGGLGYIVGIFGVVAYFMSKKQPRS